MDLFKAILSIRPDSKCSMTGNEYKNLIWFAENEFPPPTEEEVLEEAQKLQQEWEAKEYQRLRAPKYPNLTVLADALYWSSKGDNSHLEAYYASCEEVKNEYPKPSS